MLPNPFIEFFQHPVEAFGVIAYVLFLLGTTVLLLGHMWSTALHLGNVWEFRRHDSKFGPAWTYVPPMPVVMRVSALFLLGAVEALLLGALVWIVT